MLLIIPHQLYTVLSGRWLINVLRKFSINEIFDFHKFILMKPIQINLKKEHLIKAVLSLSKKNKRQVYLVGGFLRDLIL
jgi:hypothetical protein